MHLVVAKLLSAARIERAYARAGVEYRSVQDRPRRRGPDAPPAGTVSMSKGGDRESTDIKVRFGAGIRARRRELEPAIPSRGAAPNDPQAGE